jgi:hypothetical protein
MARGNWRIVDSGGRTANPVLRFYLKEGEAAIYAGEPVQIYPTAAASGADIAGAFYPIPLSDGLIVTGALYFLGLAAKDSTQTGTAAGSVDVYLDLPGTVYAAHPKTANTANTDSKISRRQFYLMVADLTGTKYTIDNSTAHSLNNPFWVVGGNAANDELYFVCRDGCSWRRWGNYGT